MILHRLPDDVLRLFQELSAGAYGRQWAVLLVGEDGLVSQLQALKPKPTLSSTVLLPRWDQHDLEDACSALHPGLEIAARAPQLLQQFAMHPRQLLRAASGDGRLKDSDLEAVHQRRDLSTTLGDFECGDQLKYCNRCLCRNLYLYANR